MKTAKAFDASINRDWARLTQQARAARRAHIGQLLKSAGNAFVNGIRIAAASADRIIGRRGDRAGSEASAS